MRRAERFSPFLRGAMAAAPRILDAFVADGAMVAAQNALIEMGDTVDERLRRQRLGLALAVALGDLAGELTLEQVTRLLSDFADRAIDEAVRRAIARLLVARANTSRNPAHAQSRAKPVSVTLPAGRSD